MADGGWDNSGLPPERTGLGTWARVAIGCGVALLLITAGCAGGCYYLANRVQKDPDGFKNSMLGVVRRMIQDDWDELRRVGKALETDEGARALYRGAPGLAGPHPTEEAFLEAVRGWRPLLQPVPAEIPDLESHDVSYNTALGGRVSLRYKQADGTRIEVAWKGKREAGVPRATQLVDLQVAPRP